MVQMTKAHTTKRAVKRASKPRLSASPKEPEMAHEHASVDCLDIMEEAMKFFLRGQSRRRRRRLPRGGRKKQTARLRHWLDTARSTIDSTVPASICATSGRLKCCWRCSPRQKPPMELVLPRKDEVFPALHQFGWFAIERLDVGRAGVLCLPQDDVSTQSKRMSPLQHDKVCGSVLPLV
jgi:hypothetical protein